MRKEELLFKKSEAVKNIQWYVKNVLTDEDLKTFSIPQLEKMIDLMERAEKFRESCSPFYTLSATEVVQKSTGKIAYFENSGEVREETAEEYLADRSEWDGGKRIYREILKKPKKKRDKNHASPYLLWLSKYIIIFFNSTPYL